MCSPTKKKQSHKIINDYTAIFLTTNKKHEPLSQIMLNVLCFALNCSTLITTNNLSSLIKNFLAVDLVVVLAPAPAPI